MPHIIVQAKHACNVIHDYKLELPLVTTEPVLKQRGILKMAPDYRKPVLGSVPATWTMGFHQVFEEHVVVEDESLWLLHLAFVDLERNLVREIKWKNSPRSEASTIHTPETARAGSLMELMSKFDMLLELEGIDVPQWMHGML